MKISTTFTLNAVVAIFFGLGFALMPTTLAAFYAVDLGTGGIYVAQLLGAAYLGYGVISWLIRNAGESEARKAFVTGQLITFAGGLVFSVLAQMAGTVNTMGWITIVIMAFFTFAYSYHLFRK